MVIWPHTRISSAQLDFANILFRIMRPEGTIMLGFDYIVFFPWECSLTRMLKYPFTITHSTLAVGQMMKSSGCSIQRIYFTSIYILKSLYFFHLIIISYCFSEKPTSRCIYTLMFRLGTPFRCQLPPESTHLASNSNSGTHKLFDILRHCATETLFPFVKYSRCSRFKAFCPSESNIELRIQRIEKAWAKRQKNIKIQWSVRHWPSNNHPTFISATFLTDLVRFSIFDSFLMVC